MTEATSATAARRPGRSAGEAKLPLSSSVIIPSLNAFVCHSHGNFAGVEFRHRRLGGCLHALILHPYGAIGQKPRGFDFRSHVGKLELDGLKIRDRSSELFPLLRVLQSGLVSALCHSDGERGNRYASAVEHLHAVDETFARVSQ